MCHCKLKLHTERTGASVNAHLAHRRNRLRLVAGLLVSTVAATSGCSTEIGVIIGPIETDIVRVHFRNFSPDLAVDVNFFSTTDPVNDPDVELFVEFNEITAGIGVAGTGILPPFNVDAIDLPCSSELVIGTAGGEFLGNDSGEVLGVGQARWLSEAQFGLCGRSVTFEFDILEGEFTTWLRFDD